MLHSTTRLAPCPACTGLRFLPADDRYTHPTVCEACDGEGHSVHVEHVDPPFRLFQPLAEPTRMYLATSGEEIIDDGAGLDDFIQEMSDGCGDDDVAIWLDEEAQGIRLVAVVRPQAKGEPVVVWI